MTELFLFRMFPIFQRTFDPFFTTSVFFWHFMLERERESLPRERVRGERSQNKKKKKEKKRKRKCVLSHSWVCESLYIPRTGKQC